MDTFIFRRLKDTLVTITNFSKKGIHFLYIKLIEAKSEDEDIKRHEFILNVILCGIIFLLIILDASILHASITQGENFRGIPFPIFSLIVAFFIGLLYLSRIGKYLIASHLLIVIFLIGAAYGAYQWGISMPAGLLSFALIIIISSALINSRFSFLITALLIGTLLILGSIESTYGVISDWKLEPIRMRNPVEYSVFLLLITLLSWLSNREIEKSLFRARKSEQELRQERDSLEVKVEERTKDLKQAQLEKMSQLYRFAEFGRLSSGLFHDLVKPLTVVSLHLNEIEASKDPRIKETQEHLDKVIKATRRMENFIATLRKQIQTQESQSYFSLNVEIEQAIELLSYKARKADIALNFYADEEIKTNGNSIKFHQVATNLISNAVDAYDEYHGEHRKDIDITLSQKDDTAILKVMDYGCGICPTVINKIFDPFFTTKAAHKGTGLGLSTTKTVVEKEFDGKVTVTSDIGKGSTFTISIPLTK